MSYKTSTQGTYFSQFTDKEKIAYALNLSLAKVTTDAFKAGYEWYNSPDLFNAISKQSILSDSIPKYNEINNYYCIITVNGVEYITNKTVDNILTYQGGFKLSEILGTNTEILNGTSNENSNPPTSSDFNSDGLCTKLPRQAFAYFVYWKNKLTGLGGTGNNADGTSGGLWPHSDDSLSLKLTLDNNGNNNANRIYETVIEDKTLMGELQDYTPLKIINPTFIKDVISQTTTGIPENLKQYVNKKIVINVGVPTISTWNGLANSNSSDNIAFFNPLLTKSLNEPYGYNGNGLGNGYWIRGTDSNRTNIRPDYGSSAVGEGTMIFSAMTGFILFFGVSNILTNSTGVSVKNPPCVTALRYTGETFSDGIISQGDTLPAVEVSNDKDLFINTSDNTIHRLNTVTVSTDDGGVLVTKTWVGIGGSGGGGSGEIIDKNEAHLKFWIVMLLSHFESYAINTENSIKNLSSVNLTNCKYPTSEIGSIDDENLIYALLNYRKNILANTNPSWQQVVSHKDYNEYIINKDFWKITTNIESFVFDADSSKLTYIKDMINLILFKINIDKYQLTLLDKDGNENVVTNFNDMNFIPSVDPHSNLLSDIRVFAESQLVHIQTYGKDEKNIEYNITNGTVRYLNYTYDTSITDPPSPNQTKIIFQSPLTSANTPESVYFRHQPLIQVLIDKIEEIEKQI